MARQSNLAYDFERFETQRKVKPKAKVQLEVVKKQQAQKTRYLIAKQQPVSQFSSWEFWELF